MPGTPASRRTQRNRILRRVWITAKTLWVIFVTVGALYAFATKSAVERLVHDTTEFTNHDYSNIKISLFDSLPGFNLGWIIDNWLIFVVLGLVVYVVHLKRSNGKRTQSAPPAASSHSTP